MVTPEMAKTWLSRNSGNQRSVSKKTVDERARYGSWRLATDSPGYLVQPDRGGHRRQHRLHAIISPA